MTLTVDAALDRLYDDHVTMDAEGNRIPVTGEISRLFADALTEQVTRLQPRIAVEIGMAYGASSLAILRGLGPEGRLISIDPNQSTRWKGAGKHLVSQTDRGHQHELIEAFDYEALPQLLERGTEAQFVYIDGMHTFDYVTLDAFYADKLVPVGGIVAFNDCGYRAVHKYLKFFKGHRRYEEIDVGLPGDYRSANPLFSLIRRIEGRSNQDRYFRKLEQWEPKFNFYKSF